ADGNSEPAVSQGEEVVIVTTYAKCRTAVSGVIEPVDFGQPLRKQSLLNFASDLDFSIDALALCDFSGNFLCETAVFQRQPRLCGDRSQQSQIGFRIRRLGSLWSKAQDA